MADDDLSSVVSSSTAITLSRQPETELQYATPPDNHPVYHLIGRVAAEWSRLEHALDRIIWALAGVNSPKGACITSQLLGATARYKVILAQLNLRKAQGKTDFDQHFKQIESLMKHSYTPQEQRNRIIHDAWYADGNRGIAGQFRAWPEKNRQFGIRAVDLEAMKQTIAAARSLAEAAETFFNEVCVGK